jgi:hypothetical protein
MSTNTPAGFTSDEILTSVEGIVLSSIRRPYDTLGVRRTDITFTDVQEAAAGVFLLYRDAPFYILELASQRTLEALVIEADLISQIIAAISSIGRDVLPIDDLTTLANARAALLELETAVGQRQRAFADITNIPAFLRYQSNVNQFLSGPGQNVKENGQIVQTPQEARAVLPGLITQLNASHSALVTQAMLVANGIADFGSINLPALVAEGVISKSRQILQNRLDQLEALTPEERLGQVRSTVLELLTQMGVIKQFGGFTGPTMTFEVNGIGRPFSDSTHLATPASSIAVTHGPYAIRPGKNVLDFFLDAIFVRRTSNLAITNIIQGTNVFEATFNGPFTGLGVQVGDVIYPATGANAGSRWVVKTVVSSTQLLCVGDHNPVGPDVSPVINIWPAPSVSVALANSLVATLASYLPGPFNIQLGITDVFKFKINSTLITVSLPDGPAVPGSAIVTSINAAIAAQAPGSPFFAELFYSPLKYDSAVTITSLGGFSYRFTVLAGALDGLGIFVGDQIKITSGPDAGALLTITAIGSAPILHVDALAGGALGAPATRQQIQIGTASLQNVRITCNSGLPCLTGLPTLTIFNDPSNTGATAIGFVPGFFSQSKLVQVRDLVKDFNQRTLSVVASSSMGTVYTGNINTNPLQSTNATLSKFFASASITASGLAITGTVAGGLSAAGVLVGDVVVLRNGTNPFTFFVIDSVTDTTFHAVGSIGTTTQTGINIDIGPNISALNVSGYTVRITAGPNTGDYEVVRFGDSVLDLLVTQNFPIRQTINSQPLAMTGLFGVESIVLSSIAPTIASKVEVLGSAADLMYPGGDSHIAVGTSPWFQLPKVPLGLQEGDMIKIFASQYNSASNTYDITSVDSALLAVGITPEMPSDETWTFSDSIPVPFALLVAGNVNDATGLTAGITKWAAQSVNQPSYFTDLARFMNPILSNSNPTAVEVNDAKNRVLDLLQYLTLAGASSRSADTSLTLEFVLNGYSANHVPAVDTLLKTFSDKSADKALDTLLSASFSAFFGLTAETSSYAGAMLQAVRDIAVNDLSVSKSNRTDAVQGKLISANQSNDYEYSSDDIENEGPPVA